MVRRSTIWRTTWLALATVAACRAPAQSGGSLQDATADGDTAFGGALDILPGVADGDAQPVPGADTALAPGDVDAALATDFDAAAPPETAAPDADAEPLPDAPGPDAATDAELADAAPTDAGPAACDDNSKLCAHLFTYAGTGNENTVEARGSWNGWKSGTALQASGTTWSGAIKLPQNTSFQYKFRVVGPDGKEQWKADAANPKSADDGFGGKNSVIEPLSCPTDGICPIPQTLCGAPLKPGAFDWRDGVLYFVFVDRFKNGNPANDKKNASAEVPEIANWHGGDWAGVKQKVDDGYFTALGVNILWLTVPLDNTDDLQWGDGGKKVTAFHGYWPRDIDKPNARFGSLAELKALVDAAHGKGIQVILDYAMNHVHTTSPVFAQHADWFHPLKIDGKTCTCGSNSCPWDSPAGVWCWFRDYLPDFDFDNASARKASIDNVLWWMEQSGADGLRLDAIKHVEDIWLTDLRKRLNEDLEPKRGQHIWLVGETYTGDMGAIKSFVDPCSKLDGQFDFPLRAVLDNVVLLRQGKMGDLEKFVKTNENYYGPDALMSTFAGNHDLPRIIHYAQDKPLFGNVWDPGQAQAYSNPPAAVVEKSAYERIAVAMAVLYGLPGVPLVYYGDEIGLAGAGDPDNRRSMPWSGLGDNQTWLLTAHQKLGQARKAHSALRRGVRQTVQVSDDAWLWTMTDAKDTVWVAVNRSDGPATLQGLPAGVELKDALGGPAVTGPAVTLEPRSAKYLYKP